MVLFGGKDCDEMCVLRLLGGKGFFWKKYNKRYTCKIHLNMDCRIFYIV